MFFIENKNPRTEKVTHFWWSAFTNFLSIWLKKIFQSIKNLKNNEKQMDIIK